MSRFLYLLGKLKDVAQTWAYDAVDRYPFMEKLLGRFLIQEERKEEETLKTGHFHERPEVDGVDPEAAIQSNDRKQDTQNTTFQVPEEAFQLPNAYQDAEADLDQVKERMYQMYPQLRPVPPVIIEKKPLALTLQRVDAHAMQKSNGRGCPKEFYAPKSSVPETLTLWGRKGHNRRVNGVYRLLEGKVNARPAYAKVAGPTHRDGELTTEVDVVIYLFFPSAVRVLVFRS
mmetsp:Transcript_83604/g.190793  ORF Transcript_83604/g.190793 Transcript_83604/m.190793 type:complete len:230 (-) Transcript_83604:226-915(-)